MNSALSSDGLAPKPDHVPDDLVFDFDSFSPPGAEEDVHMAWYSLHANAPDMFWTPRNQGHWIAARGKLIHEIQQDHEHFSHQFFTVPIDRERAANAPSIPLSLDPPEHTKYRRLFTRFFLPGAARKLDDTVRSFAIELIEELAPRGECDFVKDFARHLPIAVFLGLMNLPMEDRKLMLPWAEIIVRSSDNKERARVQLEMHAYLKKWVEARRENPGEDIVSAIVIAEIDGEPITEKKLYGMLQLLLAGGLDTVAAMMSFSARFLASNPAHLQDLVEHPELTANAVEEFIRRHGLTNTARYVTQDYEFYGVQLKKGDMVQIPNMLYGLDDRIVENPLDVDFRRESSPLAAFGHGPHTCPGAPLARRELTIFLEEWLKKIPKFEIKPGSTPITASGHVNGIRNLDLVWDPESVIK